MRVFQSSVALLAALLVSHAAQSAAAATSCPDLRSTLSFTDLNGTVIRSEYIPAWTNVTVGGEQGLWCMNYTVPEVDICRVTLNIGTSPQSNTFVEVWLPSGSGDDAWNGRFLSTGGSGLSGCVDYGAMVYTSSLGFAATGDNSGHNGTAGNGTAFLNNNDVVIDFSYRARHSAVLAGKIIVRQFYGEPHNKSYYYGCSTGGRQGLKAAQMFPNDFDGIIAGAPASDFNHLASWSGHFITLTGLNESDPRWLGVTEWTAVHAEVLKQCDPLDGVLDGILEDSSICNFNPETILCSRTNSTGCLTPEQAHAVREVFSPVYGVNGSFVMPRLSPSAELAAFLGMGFGALAGGLVGPGPQWYQNVIYNNTSWDPTTFNALDIAYADSLDAQHGYVSSFYGDLSAFRAAGGKLISYHGGADPVIPGEQAMRYYNHVASTMNASHTDLDGFFRLFRISGMGHCESGNGAWAFGQTIDARNASTAILLDLVDWVEKGEAPEVMVGTKFVNDTSADGIEFERPHCRYPYRTTFKEGNPNITSSWGCEYIEDWNVCGGSSDRLPKLC
ncbi:hypothetical protein AAFC00_007331 [Neodothiora populina]|uniref:Carboxylic ester hydrolase n=1 Tax=Neodothiora populina TaxID=2781224 RepID=A0ABR3PI62_9PEZI